MTSFDQTEEFLELLTESDKDYINKQQEKPMEPTYNKVQYSEFTPDRVGQWVLRGDTIEEVLQMKEKLFGMAKPAVIAPVPQKQFYAGNEPVDQVLVSCKDCGGPTTYRTGVSKSTGKPWKGYFCNNNRDHKAYFVK